MPMFGGKEENNIYINKDIERVSRDGLALEYVKKQTPRNMLSCSTTGW